MTQSNLNQANIGDYEIGTILPLRWYQKTRETTTKPPVLQYLCTGTGRKDGEMYCYERWLDIPLVIGEENE